MSSVSHDASKCPCGVCHLKRVESGAQDAYERHLRAATDKVLHRLKRGDHSEPEHEEESDAPPLCYKCKKARAWRGECVDCYMAQHSEPWMDAYGRRRFPDTHNIRQGYYMEEEQYAHMRRAERERRAAAKSLFSAASKADTALAAASAMPGGKTELGFVKNLFETLQGVKHDSKCPHGLPFYACMSCSH